MGKRKKGNPINAWINFDKPYGMTSTQAIGRIRRAFSPQKIGHAGTLDPLATGILPIAMGEATKTIPFMQDTWKGYRFTILWGKQTNTDDAEGEVIAENDHRPTKEDIEAILADFTGEIEQMPPQFSAIKIKGERAYNIARRGEIADIKPRMVEIDELTLVSVEDGISATFECVCGKGTYIRSLGRDIALKLATVGHVSDLRRFFVGNFAENTSISLAFLEKIGQSAPLNVSESFDKGILLPLTVALDDILALTVDSKEADLLKHGQALSFISRQDAGRLPANDEDAALAVYQDNPIAIVEIKGAMVKPVRVFNL